jgi:hypothetical protein
MSKHPHEARILRLKRDIAKLTHELSGFSDDTSEILSVMSFMTGCCAALMDPRRFTPQQVQKLVDANFHAGNRATFEEMKKKPHSAKIH